MLGVSADSSKSHAKFKQKNELPFTLLADTTRQVIEAYGVWGKKKFMGREYDGILRTTFLISAAGEILKVYEKVRPAEHAEEILRELGELLGS